MDKATFYNAIRATVPLTVPNVQGFDRLLDYAEMRKTLLNRAAYVLATTYWETSHTMQPVREAFWLTEAWRKAHLRYYPYYGRGLIQTTWKANYAKMGQLIGADLVAHPDLLLEWEFALPALFLGMEKGIYTGKDLDDFIDAKDESDTEDLREYRAARAIVNGSDKADKIAHLALTFERGLREANY